MARPPRSRPLSVPRAVLAGWAAAGLLAGCSDYNLFGLKPEEDVTDTASRGGPDTAGGSVTDVCLGDPSIDAAVSSDATCLSTAATGTLDTVIEWEARTLGNWPEYGHVLMAPVVGPLFDGDADGDVDADDPSSIVVVTDDGGADDANSHGVLRIVDGRTGTPVNAVSKVEQDDAQIFPYRYSNAALGDVDGDGVPEIVIVVNVVGGPPGDPGGGTDTASGADDTGGGTDTDVVVRPSTGGWAWGRLFGATPPWMPPPPASGGACRVAAYTPSLTLKWYAADASIACGGHAPALADLEGDGTVEVMVGATILEGATGAVRATGALGGGRPAGFSEAGWMSFGADLDGDGQQEVVTGAALYAPDGSTLCATGREDGFPAVADLDLDGTGELVVVANGWLRVFDARCGLRTEVALAGSGIGGPPAIGDLDADGAPEIGVGDAATYTVYEADGTVLWSVPVTDASSSSTGAAFFDFDGDGGLEVVYADEVALWILDGATGAVRLQDDTHSSRTLHELPVIVDVDGDGATEIVVPNGGAHSDTPAQGLYVLGSADGSWATNRRVWNQHAYSVTNIDDALRVPARPLSNWPTYNTFRSGTIDPVSAGALADAVPLADVCLEACADGWLVVHAAVGNAGAARLRAGVPVSVYVDGALADTRWTDDVVDVGGVSAHLRFEVPAGADVRVVVDDAGDGFGRVFECMETNNIGAGDGCR